MPLDTAWAALRVLSCCSSTSTSAVRPQLLLLLADHLHAASSATEAAAASSVSRTVQPSPPIFLSAVVQLYAALESHRTPADASDVDPITASVAPCLRATLQQLRVYPRGDLPHHLLAACNSLLQTLPTARGSTRVTGTDLDSILNELLPLLLQRLANPAPEVRTYYSHTTHPQVRATCYLGTHYIPLGMRAGAP